MEASPCGPGDSFTYIWELVSNTGPTFIIPSLSLRSEFFRIPVDTFFAGASYEFAVTVAVASNPDLKNTANLRVRVASSPLEAVIEQTDHMHSLTATSRLLLEGTASRDPDVEGEDTELELEWSCVLEASSGRCFSPEQSPLSPPPSSSRP